MSLVIEQCVAEETPKHSVSVAGAVVRDDGRVLAIQRRDNAKWEPPGGVLELEESIEDGVRREILEETGLEVVVEQLTGVYKNLDRGIIALFFRCRPGPGSPTRTREASDVRWIDSTEIPKIMDPAYAVRVQDAIAPGSSPAVRLHDGFALLPSADQRA
jgi:8-oxo-dGTP diphosphatase